MTFQKVYVFDLCVRVPLLSSCQTEKLKYLFSVMRIFVKIKLKEKRRGDTLGNFSSVGRNRIPTKLGKRGNSFVSFAESYFIQSGLGLPTQKFHDYETE